MKVVGVSIAIAILAVAMYLASLNYRGFCFVHGKYLSEAEKIAVVVEDVLARYPPAVIRTPVKGHAGVYSINAPGNAISYAGREDFLDKNSGCCMVVRRITADSRMPSLFERSTGVIYGRAVIAYDVIYIDEAGVKRTAGAREIIPVSNCGVPQRWWDSAEITWPMTLYKFVFGGNK